MTPGSGIAIVVFMFGEADGKGLREMRKTQACRDFTLEFTCPIVDSNPYAVRLLGKTIRRAMKESSLRLHPGFWLRSRKRHQWKVNIGCYDLDAKTFVVKQMMVGIAGITEKNLNERVHCRRGKVILPPVGPRTKPTTAKPSLAAQLEMWEKYPDKARTLQKQLDAEANRDYQRRYRNSLRKDPITE